jgi:hypothetical protein
MFSWFPAGKINYEKILFDLENKIKSQVDMLERIQKEEVWYLDSINSLFKVYLVWMMCMILYSYIYKVAIAKLVIGIIVPLLMMQGSKKMLQIYYSLYKKRLEKKLHKIRLYQMEQIEELKNKTAYYSTKGLIERYETPLKRTESMSSISDLNNNPLPNGNPNGNGQMRTPLGLIAPQIIPSRASPGVKNTLASPALKSSASMNGIRQDDSMDLKSSTSSN